MTDLELEAERLTELLGGKEVAEVFRHRKNEIVIKFCDGTRVFIDTKVDDLELSVTGC